jgi:hypothetical protein
MKQQPQITNDFSSYHFQSDLTVGNNYKEPNPTEYLTNFAVRLNILIDKDNIDMTADKRNKLAAHLNEVLKLIKNESDKG